MEIDELVGLERPIFQFFTNRRYPREAARDLTQRTLLEAHRSRDRFRGESKFATWVLSIAKNIWRLDARDSTTQKRSAAVIPLEDLGEKHPAAGLRHPLSKVIEAEQVQAVRRAMEQLPSERRQCFQLFYDQELRYEEIATVLQIPVHRVKSHLFEARKKLKRLLVASPADSEA